MSSTTSPGAREGSLEAPTRHPLAWQHPDFLNEALLLKLLPVVDDFERAFQKIPQEWAASPWVSCINMILRKLQAVLKSTT